MKIVLFYHAFTSCWNNGNAHFVRGVTRELVKLGHDVTLCEPRDGWSRSNALKDGPELLQETATLVPGVRIEAYDGEPDLDMLLDDAELVIVHEWNPPELIAAIGRRRWQGARFQLLFHDTHHRAITAPHEVSAFDLSGYDGVLAFGEVLREIYLKRDWARRAYTWHEAADVELYQPMPEVQKQWDLVWIGNWGDDERSSELMEYLVEPVRRLSLSAQIYGVRYPEHAKTAIAAAGIGYGGWLPNHRAPLAFAKARATVHVPRAPYARQLAGIPTIRVFEALACGIPLVSAPWTDAEGLFPSGCYISVSSGEAMVAALSAIQEDVDLAASLVRNGLNAIRERHTCRHRAQELLAIADDIASPASGRQWDRIAS
jgi:spore maturation protein CgeB